jgi:MbtH protein
MNSDGERDDTIYKIVVNPEEQYSIWPTDRENALGRNDVGKTGTREECLAYIKEVWTDMRPLSLRKRCRNWRALTREAGRSFLELKRTGVRFGLCLSTRPTVCVNKQLYLNGVL